jgi:hypothetical protein
MARLFFFAGFQYAAPEFPPEESLSSLYPWRLSIMGKDLHGQVRLTMQSLRAALKAGSQEDEESVTSRGCEGVEFQPLEVIEKDTCHRNCRLYLHREDLELGLLVKFNKIKILRLWHIKCFVKYLIAVISNS